MDTRLNEFDLDEWWDICRHLHPELTREEFEQMWAGFEALKRSKAKQ